MAPPYLSRWDGGSLDDEESEYAQAVLHLVEGEGFWPLDFNTIALSERFHIPPWELDAAPAAWVKRMALYARVMNQGEKDRQENADLQATGQEAALRALGRD